MRIMTTAGLFAILTIAVVIILGQAGPALLRPLRLLRHRRLHGRPPHHQGRRSRRLAALVIGALVAGADRPDRRAAGAQAALLLPGSGHHRAGPDLPGPGARNCGRSPAATTGLAPDPDAQHLRVRLQHATCASTTWSGSSRSSSSCSSTARSSTGRAGPAGHRHQRDRLLDPRDAHRQLEAARLCRQRRHLRPGRRPVRLRHHGRHPELLHLHRRHPPHRHDAAGRRDRCGAPSSGPSS